MHIELVHDFGPAARRGFLGFHASLDHSLLLLETGDGGMEKRLHHLRDGRTRVVATPFSLQAPPTPCESGYVRFLPPGTASWELLDARCVSIGEIELRRRPRSALAFCLTVKNIVRVIFTDAVHAVQLDGSRISAVGTNERDVAPFSFVGGVNAVDDDVWFTTNKARLVRWGDRAQLEVWSGAPKADAFAFAGDRALFCSLDRVGAGVDVVVRPGDVRLDHTIQLGDAWQVPPPTPALWQAAVGVGRRLFLCDGQGVWSVNGWSD